MQMKSRKLIRLFNSPRIKYALIFICILFSDLTTYAQGPGGDPGGDPDLIPIDGGLGFLLAAGVGYGVKKARDLKRKG
jgi:hypothetical protein